MKKLLILFVFISSTCFSQVGPVFNFEKNKAYKITMKGADNLVKADNIERQMEKLQLAIFSFVDPTTSMGYFIVDNLNKIQEIEKTLNNEKDFSFSSFEEIPLTEESFLEMYMKRGGFEKAEFSKNIPKQIVMGPYQELSSSLYLKALIVWEKKYKNAFNKLQGLPEHYPVFFNTGNPEYDNARYGQAKEDWIKNYPDEVEKITGRSYKDATGMEHSKDIEKKKSSNK
ncbi:MAG: hypothetical protein A3F72_14970 [Bacteroidetes bacterium RIFCSPLOWO2_12_FULL_35_15]|nr:MAG: hypothetical protein A3F72_14970 [Bacteroidetes bacterium RIFCSPLOWO2_12_FULL_35_15]